MPRLDRIYTKTGDEGMTGLGGGQRVAKDSHRVETYGTVDELNSQIGVALATGLCERLTTELPAIQNELFDLGSDLCDAGDEPGAATRSRPSRRATSRQLERLIDEFNEVVGPLTNFLLPGGSPGAAQLHVARTICRRAEREATTLGPRRDDRPDRPPLPQPPVRRAVRDGALREPRARRRRAALGAWNLMSILSKIKDCSPARRARAGAAGRGRARVEARSPRSRPRATSQDR